MLDDAVKGGLRPSMVIVWERNDITLAGTYEAEDLTGATLTGWLRNRATEVKTPITGTLSVVDGPNGTFLWTFSEADVSVAGTFDVEFQATYAEGPSPAKTFPTKWRVLDSIAIVAQG